MQRRSRPNAVSNMPRRSIATSLWGFATYAHELFTSVYDLDTSTCRSDWGPEFAA
jgi:hypothetical protein